MPLFARSPPKAASHSGDHRQVRSETSSCVRSRPSPESASADSLSWNPMRATPWFLMALAGSLAALPHRVRGEATPPWTHPSITRWCSAPGTGSRDDSCLRAFCPGRPRRCLRRMPGNESRRQDWQPSQPSPRDKRSSEPNSPAPHNGWQRGARCGFEEGSGMSCSETRVAPCRGRRSLRDRQSIQLSESRRTTDRFRARLGARQSMAGRP